jgi:bacterioferritin-associated ferredoxin
MSSPIQDGPPQPDVAGVVPPRMTRCECAEVSFEEIRDRVRAAGCSLDEILRVTGCGSTCTACLPDLRAFLSSQ